MDFSLNLFSTKSKREWIYLNISRMDYKFENISRTSQENWKKKNKIKKKNIFGTSRIFRIIQSTYVISQLKFPDSCIKRS